MPQEQLDLTKKMLMTAGGVAQTLKYQIRRTKAWITVISNEQDKRAQVAMALEISDTPFFDWNNTIIIATSTTGPTMLWMGELEKYNPIGEGENNESSGMKRYNISHQLWFRLWGGAAALPTSEHWLCLWAFD